MPRSDVQRIVDAIDHMTEEITDALGDHGRVVKQVTTDLIAAIDRLVAAQGPPPLDTDAFREEAKQP